MFNEAEYVEDGERFEILVLEHDACAFEGNLYSRKEGGFDLFLFRDNSEFECLELEKITWLRKQAPEGSLFIERFTESSLNRDLKGRVEDAFAKWLEANLGMPPGKFRCRWGRTRLEPVWSCLDGGAALAYAICIWEVAALG